MYPQHPDLLVLAAEARRHDLLATAERVRPVPAGLGPGYPAGAAKAVRRLLARVVWRRVEPAPVAGRRRAPVELAP